MPLKRIICIFTAVLTVLCCLPLTVSANGDEIRQFGHVTPELRLSEPDAEESEKILSQSVNVEELRALIIDNIAKTNEVIDISSFNLPHAAWSNLVDLVFYDIPEAFNVYDISGTHNGTQLLMLHFGYRDFADTPEEYAQCFGKMKENADRMLEGIENNPALSDEYKALLLHDRLAVHNSYAYYTEIDAEEHTAYGALANGSSVCQGYAMAYMYLLDRVGIENYYVSSDKLNHAWNIVYIDDKPYHVDVTFDDLNWETVEDRNVAGGVMHEFFLLSTKAFREREHNAEDFNSSPVSTKYDNYFWRNSEAEFQLVGNKLYYIDSKNRALMCVGESEALTEVRDVWTAGGNSFWVGNFARLSSAGGELLYSLSDGIYKYTVETGVTEKIHSPYLHEKFSVFGFTYKDGQLLYDVNTDPPGGDVTYLKYESAPYNAASHIMCSIEAESTAEYYIGDSFNEEKITVKANFTDNTSEILKEGVVFSGFDSSTAGKKMVTVSYGGFETLLATEIKTPLVTLPENAEINTNEETTLTAETKPSGLAVKWTSSSDAVTVNNGKITGAKPGTAEITAEITYNGKTYSAVCTVNVICTHKNTFVHKEIPPTVETTGFTEGVFCNDCEKYISGHEEIPVIDLSFSPSDFMTTDGKNVRIIVGKLVTELLWSCPRYSFVREKNGNTADESSFVATGMVLVLPDGSMQEIVVPGDVDGDAQLTSSDARLALRAAVGLESYTAESPYGKAADADKDNTLSASDARLILRASVGLEDVLPWL